MSAMKDQPLWVVRLPGPAGVSFGPLPANTKSEARAAVKRAPGVPLPPGTVTARAPAEGEVAA